MAITLQNADNALKNVYLDVIAEQLNMGTSPFLSAIKQSTENVYGKEVRKLAVYGRNLGVGAGTEDGDLPTARGNNYAQMVTTLKNLYGTIEISDKAIRASENNAGAFVNLLNAEMEGLIKSSNYNLNRMLFGDGNGALAILKTYEGDAILIETQFAPIEVGMCVDFYTLDGERLDSICGQRVTEVMKERNRIAVTGMGDTFEMPNDVYIVQSGCWNNELTGLRAIFDIYHDEIYGLRKSEHDWLNPCIANNVGEITESKLQRAIDEIEEASGSAPNFIICSWGVRRALQALFASSNTRIDTMNLEGGFTAMSYNGIPIVADRFCPEGTLYMLNTNDFELHQLCDWQWLEGDDGKVLKQIPGKPVYTATLVKYCELLCSRPCGQGMLSGITEA